MASYLDAESAALVAELVIQDIEAVTSTRKGKSRYSTPLTDEEIAFQIQEESLRLMLNDLRLAQSIDRALDTDAALIIAAQATDDDYRYATALERGEQPPEQSEWQRLVEDPAFGTLWVICFIYLSIKLTTRQGSRQNSRWGRR